MDTQKIIDKVKCFLLDLDGTVYLEGKLIGDMQNTLKKIRESGRKIVYLTNNSSRSKKGYIEKLKKVGIFEEVDDVYTSGNSMEDYLNTYHKGESVYLVGTEELKEEFVERGIKLSDTEADVVVLSYDTELEYKKLVKLVTFMHRGAKYVCTHGDINCPAQEVYLPDIGSFIALIEKSTGKTPEVNCGKPYTEMGDAIKRMLNMSGDEIMMCGDRLYTDIAFGGVNGISTMLVLSGETSMEEYKKSSTQATVVFDSLNDLQKYL